MGVKTKTAIRRSMGLGLKGKLTKRKILCRVRELIGRDQTGLVSEVEQLLNTGFLELSDWDNDYGLPQLLLTLAYEWMAFCRRPVAADLLKTYNELKNF